MVIFNKNSSSYIKTETNTLSYTHNVLGNTISTTNAYDQSVVDTNSMQMEYNDQTSPSIDNKKFRRIEYFGQPLAEPTTYTCEPPEDSSSGSESYGLFGVNIKYPKYIFNTKHNKWETV